MEQLMEEIHASVCHGPSVKEAQVFVSTVVQLLTKGSQCDMIKTRCWATPQRWLFMLDILSLSTALWNPMNQKKVKLSSVKKDLPKNCKCLLSYEPKSPRCVVLIVDADEPVIWFCRVGGKEWTRHEYTITVEKSPILFHYLPYREFKDESAEHSSHGETSSEDILNGDGNEKRRRISNDVHDTANENRRYGRFKIQSIVAIDEKFYFDISASELGVIEFTLNPTFSTIQFKILKVSRNCWELAFPHLVESRGRLYLVVYGRNCIRNMCVFKMDFSRLEWCSVDRLYDQVFFVGKFHFTASYSARELGLKQGNIYYQEVAETIYVFFLGDEHMYSYTSTFRHVIADNLPDPLLSIYKMLTEAYCFTIGNT